MRELSPRPNSSAEEYLLLLNTVTFYDCYGIFDLSF
jgi:hypothetical protein